MRCFGVGPIVPTSPSGRRLLDCGIGANLDLVQPGICPVARVRLFDAVRLHFWPKPLFKLKHAFPLWNTGLCIHAGFLQHIDCKTIRNIGKRGLWRVAIGRTGENSLLVSPDRIELSNFCVKLGPTITTHISGELSYPRVAPDPLWRDQFNFLPSRVCVKVAW